MSFYLASDSQSRPASVSENIVTAITPARRERTGVGVALARRRAAMLSEFGLEAWTNALLPVLDEIVRSAEGHADPAFWRSFFRHESGSGPSELTGWILVLFPYLEGGTPNPHLASWEAGYRRAETKRVEVVHVAVLEWRHCLIIGNIARLSLPPFAFGI